MDHLLLHGALHILCREVYHLKDTFPELCKVHGIISAIPISSCTAERSFSALKRVKTWLRSTGEAGRIIALVSRTQNTANSDERVNNWFICTFILSPLKCVIVVPLYVSVSIYIYGSDVGQQHLIITLMQFFFTCTLNWKLHCIINGLPRWTCTHMYIGA